MAYFVTQIVRIECNLFLSCHPYGYQKEIIVSEEIFIINHIN